MTMTRIRRNTSAIYSRNINRARRKAIIAAYNPANIYFCYYMLDFIF